MILTIKSAPDHVIYPEQILSKNND